MKLEISKSSSILTRWILILVFFCVLFGIFIGSFTTTFILQAYKPTDQDRIRQYYEVESAALVSPVILRQLLDKGDRNFILVDVRSREDYLKEHIVGAINIAAYKDPQTTYQLETDRVAAARMVGLFADLPKKHEIIIYGDSQSSSIQSSVGKLLADNDIYVKNLMIGWYEWRHNWVAWNRDVGSIAKVDDYVVIGKDPGIPKIRLNSNLQ